MISIVPQRILSGTMHGNPLYDGGAVGGPAGVLRPAPAAPSGARSGGRPASDTARRQLSLALSPAMELPPLSSLRPRFAASIARMSGMNGAVQGSAMCRAAARAEATTAST